MKYMAASVVEGPVDWSSHKAWGMDMPMIRAEMPIMVEESTILEVGQKCFVIGAPSLYRHSFTAGKISGLNRDVSRSDDIQIRGMIQLIHSRMTTVTPYSRATDFLSINSDKLIKRHYYYRWG
ncbi:hypothetical protein KSP39_PZI003228 [Platanthera zijinensis]|uniref:Uncharacterized protein n=1 Tax=Platanthera zijinensis TaxID=2320716 RepID=A0AAP0GBX1_9ASPA